MSKVEEIFLCIDEVIETDEQYQQMIETALQHNPANALKPSTKTEDSNDTSKLALETGYRWLPGTKIRIAFLDGDDTLKNKVKEYANEWTQHANLHFKYVEDLENSDVRIIFDTNKHSSQVGTKSKNIDATDPTMHLAKSDFYYPLGGIRQKDMRQIVLHEFGHMIGCIHEHQNPSTGIQWDEDKVIAHYKAKQNWDEKRTRFNVLDKFDKTITQYSEFDPDSIMGYWFPAELTKNDIELKRNFDLSKQDIEYIKLMYPKHSWHIKIKSLEFTNLDDTFFVGLNVFEQPHRLAKPFSTGTIIQVTEDDLGAIRIDEKLLIKVYRAKTGRPILAELEIENPKNEGDYEQEVELIELEGAMLRVHYSLLKL